MEKVSFQFNMSAPTIRFPAWMLEQDILDLATLKFKHDLHCVGKFN